jgi:DNA polymerase IIIc chi subunit
MTRTTHQVQRLDMLLAQADQFLAHGLEGEAIARAKQVLAYAMRAEKLGQKDLSAIKQRAVLARSLLRRLGQTDAQLRYVDASSAKHAKAWS